MPQTPSQLSEAASEMSSSIETTSNGRGGLVGCRSPTCPADSSSPDLMQSYVWIHESYPNKIAQRLQKIKLPEPLQMSDIVNSYDYQQEPAASPSTNARQSLFATGIKSPSLKSISSMEESYGSEVHSAGHISSPELPGILELLTRESSGNIAYQSTAKGDDDEQTPIVQSRLSPGSLLSPSSIFQTSLKAEEYEATQEFKNLAKEFTSSGAASAFDLEALENSLSGSPSLRRTSSVTSLEKESPIAHLGPSFHPYYPQIVQMMSMAPDEESKLSQSDTQVVMARDECSSIAASYVKEMGLETSDEEDENDTDNEEASFLSQAGDQEIPPTETTTDPFYVRWIKTIINALKTSFKRARDQNISRDKVVFLPFTSIQDLPSSVKVALLGIGCVVMYKLGISILKGVE